ncbi:MULTISPECIES: signal peptidase II [unclassified Mycoplasma]|uniref:signal peptidase II n=1 Tax=unclassified Mycoplasma TaxID=2683645 RepID=UPI00211C8A03|nr:MULTISPECIES: signal peptidase II [unclassified Mycoplasma]UUM20019.1 signal peptidase II [Mycoplasma sp. 1578d]UUM25000.1 signal peptidase II [Mycoplasma sp. 3686d]
MNYKSIAKNFVKSIKTNHKFIWYNFGIFLGVFVALLLIDQITKTFLFDHGDVFKMNAKGEIPLLFPDGSVRFVRPESINPASPNEWTNWKIIGFRSVWHHGVTILPNPNFKIIQAISVLIVILGLVLPFFTSKKSRMTFICLGIIASGAFGNALDRFLFLNHVKDIFYLPWADKGTFNFADVCIILGMIILIVYLFISFIIDVFKESKQEKQEEIEENKLIVQISATQKELNLLTNKNIRHKRRNKKLLISRRKINISRHK